MAAPAVAAEQSSRRTPLSLWIVGVLSLLWNSVGAFDYLATQLELESYMGQFSEQQLAYFQGFPAWVVACWALGVWGAFAGSLGLLLRRRWAVWAFAVSIFGMVFTTLYSFVLSDGLEVMGTGNAAFSAVIWLIAIFLLVYSRRMAAAGFLR